MLIKQIKHELLDVNLICSSEGYSVNLLSSSSLPQWIHLCMHPSFGLIAFAQSLLAPLWGRLLAACTYVSLDSSSSLWSIYPGCVINRVCANIFLSILQVEQLIFFHLNSATDSIILMQLVWQQWQNVWSSIKNKEKLDTWRWIWWMQLRSKTPCPCTLVLKAEGCTLCVYQFFFLSEPSTTFLPGRTLVFILATSWWNTSSCTDCDTPAVQFGRWMALALVSGSAW